MEGDLNAEGEDQQPPVSANPKCSNFLIPTIPLVHAESWGFHEATLLVGGSDTR